MHKLSASGRVVVTIGAGLLAFSLTGLHLAMAQTVRATGDCPAPPPGQAPTSGTAGRALVEGLVLYTGANLDDRVNANVGFRSDLQFYDTAAGRVFVKVPVDSKRSICGWAQAEYVLTEHRPLSVQEYEADKVVDRRSAKNPLFVKAMIRSAPQTAIDTKTEFKSDDTPIFSRPYDDYDLDPALRRPARPIVAKARVFGIFYVYKKVTRNKLGTDDKRTWLYVAGANANDTNTVAGWIPSDDVFVWDNQLSLYYNDSSKEPVDIFANLPALRTRDAAKILGSKPTASRAPLDRNIPRFPVLGRSKLTADEFAYKIAYYGCWDSGCGAEAAAPRKEVTSALDEIAELARRVKNVDILFLIDNTESMSKYFRPIAQSVQQAAQTLTAGRKDGAYRFAVATYGDYHDASADPAKMDFDLFHFDSSPASLARIFDIKTYIDRMSDSPEAGFAGIKRAVDEVRWGTEAGYRVVFWVGDHGNRPVGQRERTAAADVREALRSKNVAVFVPINVAGSYRKAENDAFIRQANEVTQRELPSDQRKLHCCQAFNTHDDGKKINDGEDAGRRTREIVEAIFASSRELPQWIRAQRGADEQESSPAPRRVSATSDLPLVELREAPLHAWGWSSEAIQLVYKTKSLMTDGFVRYNEKRRPLDFWVAIQSKDLDLLSYLAKSLCTALRGSDPQSVMENTFQQLAQTTSGDPFRRDQEEPSQFLERLLFLPKEHFSDLLSRKLDDFGLWWRQNARSPQGVKLRANVCRSQFLLGMVYQKERVEMDSLAVTDPDSGTWRLKEGVKPQSFKWLWELENGFEIYYLPASFLPGSRE
jgi:hypothetical protein